MRPGKVKRSIGSKAAKSGTMLRASSGAPSPWTCRLCKRPGGDLIPIASTNHFTILDELSAPSPHDQGTGVGEAGAPAIAAPAQQDYMERTSVPSLLP